MKISRSACRSPFRMVEKTARPAAPDTDGKRNRPGVDVEPTGGELLDRTLGETTEVREPLDGNERLGAPAQLYMRDAVDRRPRAPSRLNQGADNEPVRPFGPVAHRFWPASHQDVARPEAAHSAIARYRVAGSFSLSPDIWPSFSSTTRQEPSSSTPTSTTTKLVWPTS